MDLYETANLHEVAALTLVKVKENSYRHITCCSFFFVACSQLPEMQIHKYKH